jgi:hypothetical protein
MSLEKRIEALERSYGTEPCEEDPADALSWARRRAEFAAKLERVEETEGNPRRRIALSELKETMKERVRRRTGGP